MWNAIDVFMKALPWIAVFLFGNVSWFAIQNFGLPDPLSIWLAKRQNGWRIVLPFALLAVFWGIVNAITFVVKSIDFSWNPVSVEPWVWWMLFGGGAFVLVYAIVRKITNKPFNPFL